MRRGPYRHGAIITGVLLSTATEIMEWEGENTGEITNIWLHSLDVPGDAEVSVFILPPGVTTASNQYLVSPRRVPVPNQSSLDFELSNPLFINKGERLVAIADFASRVIAVACSRETAIVLQPQRADPFLPAPPGSGGGGNVSVARTGARQNNPSTPFGR